MNKTIVKDLAKDTAKQPAQVGEKRVYTSDGRRVKVSTIDANSPSFSADLTELFTRNVAKARRENKKLFGSPNGIRK